MNCRMQFENSEWINRELRSICVYGASIQRQTCKHPEYCDRNDHKAKSNSGMSLVSFSCGYSVAILAVIFLVYFKLGIFNLILPPSSNVVASIGAPPSFPMRSWFFSCLEQLHQMHGLKQSNLKTKSPKCWSKHTKLELFQFFSRLNGES